MQVIFGAIFLVSSLFAGYYAADYVWGFQNDVQTSFYEAVDSNFEGNLSSEIRFGFIDSALTRGILGLEHLVLLVGLEMIIVILSFILILQGLINLHKY